MLEISPPVEFIVEISSPAACRRHHPYLRGLPLPDCRDYCKLGLKGDDAYWFGCV